MRKQLKPYIGKELRWSGIFERFGSRKVRGCDRKTIVLRDLYNRDSQIFIDHIWIRNNRKWSVIGELLPGDVVNFVACVGRYTKAGGSVDLGLKQIKKIVKVED